MTALAIVPKEPKYTLLSGHPASDHQAAIFDALTDPRSGSKLVIAVAGSGKTTTLKNGLRYVPAGSHVQGLAFGKDAAANLKAALDELIETDGPERYRNVRMGTGHSVCYRALLKYLGVKADQMKPDSGKMRRILKSRLTEGDDHEKYAAFVAKLVGYAKNEGIGALVPDEEWRWHELIEHHAMYLDAEDATIERAVEIARKALVYSTAVARRNRSVDFDDLPYLVIAWKIRLWQNDLVLLDECFVPETPILIGLNGEQRSIGELVEEEYSGPIVTWSEEQGTHIGQVIGVKKTPVGKPMVRIRTRQRGYAKNGSRLGKLTEEVRYGVRTLVCTEDHRIWTDVGWIYAKDLRPGTIVKHETSAPIVRSYQSQYAHSSSGRKSLSVSGDASRFGVSHYVPYKFENRGGNGRGPTRHEALLIERLGDGWIYNYAVSLGKRTKGFPTNYKIDVANPILMIGIEVDGESHNIADRMVQDRKKDEALKLRGWTVVRIKNEEVLGLTDDILRERITKCPTDAEVITVEPWTNRKHSHVYDLTVEGTHCYFAHGLLVHNCQDTNPVGRAVARLLLKKNGRLFAVGDKMQAIFGFRGASSDSIDLIKREFNCGELPLTVSYRCAREIVYHVRQWVSYIDPADTAIQGEVFHDVTFKDATLTAADAILCRCNAPLISKAYQLIAAGVGCRVLGRDIADQLVDLIRAMKAKGIDRLIEKLDAFRTRETARLIAKGQETAAEAIDDRVDCVMTCIQALPETERTVPALERRIVALFENQADGVLTLASVHKSKGLEWPTVAILRPDLMPSRAARTEQQEEEEVHIQVVAATRAKQRLLYLAVEE